MFSVSCVRDDVLSAKGEQTAGVHVVMKGGIAE